MIELARPTVLELTITQAFEAKALMLLGSIILLYSRPTIGHLSQLLSVTVVAICVRG